MIPPRSKMNRRFIVDVRGNLPNRVNDNITLLETLEDIL